MIHLYKRKLSATSHKFVEVKDSTLTATTPNTPNTPNSISTNVSSTSSQTEDDYMNSDQLPSTQRSSVSSIIAIEVMTDTLSNLMRAQGGEIEVSTPTATFNDAFDHGTILFKVKSLDNEIKEKHPSNSRCNFRHLVSSFFGKMNPETLNKHVTKLITVLSMNTGISIFHGPTIFGYQ
ncbi:28875_t:CDS:2 [Dentiscutata erythropus]|uniref:28875_t:CDS:1 n=1 Tax=Dentiscutata erythropus TaxID=1348616 RepID=A0A9N9H2U0_9GLOM|nr:28875_t:CDS:2 [Dentiscutata erythropus]